jgi:hypothetical protein
MKWLVEITNIVPNSRFLSDLLVGLNAKLHLEDSTVYLISDKFESSSISSEVWATAERMHNVICEVSSGFPDASVRFELVKLCEQENDGSRSNYVFASTALLILKAVTISGVGTVSPAKKISEEEKVILKKEEEEHKYQEKLALLSARVSSAFWDERALKVHRFLQQELNPLRMGHIMDLILDDLEGSLDKLYPSSKKKLDRFYHSINHPTVFGDDSRHIISKKQAPPKPMSLEEAQAFVSAVADLWFNQKCRENSNT